MADRPYQKQTRGIVIGLDQFERLKTHIAEAGEAFPRELADHIGQQQEDAARRRINETKRSPEGKRWPAWSKRYANTRERQHSLLVDSGALGDSMTHNVISPLEVEVGSNLIYAASHLFGTDDIPQRAYLDTQPGFADSRDREEIRDIIRDLWEREVLR